MVPLGARPPSVRAVQQGRCLTPSHWRCVVAVTHFRGHPRGVFRKGTSIVRSLVDALKARMIMIFCGSSSPFIFLEFTQQFCAFSDVGCACGLEVLAPQTDRMCRVRPPVSGECCEAWKRLRTLKEYVVTQDWRKVHSRGSRSRILCMSRFAEKRSSASCECRVLPILCAAKNANTVSTEKEEHRLAEAAKITAACHRPLIWSRSEGSARCRALNGPHPRSPASRCERLFPHRARTLPDSDSESDEANSNILGDFPRWTSFIANLMLSDIA